MLGGKPGAAFDELIEAAGLSRAELFLTNSIRHRAPNGRIQDYPEALFACAAWTEWEMQAYQPALVIAMGRIALQSVFGKEATVGGMRGTFTPLPAKHEWGSRSVMATYSPGAANFDESVRDLIVQDLRAAKRMWQCLSA
jgi:DNA polymerase